MQVAGRASAGEAPTAGEVRAAVARSLPYLEQEGAAWMKQRACISCHQVPAMLWSLHEARRGGVAVDAERVARWNSWLLDNGRKQGVYYKLTAEALVALGEAGLPADDVTKSESLKDENFVFEQDFREALAATLSADALRRHADAVLKAARKAGQGGGGGGTNNQYAAMLLSGAPDAAADPPAVRRSLVAGIVQAQKADGSWPVGAQFMAQQRSAAEATEDAARWTVLALNGAPDPSPEAIAAVAKAEKYLEQAVADLSDDDAKSNETLLLRAMSAHRHGPSQRSRELLERLLKQQHADGGWGWVRDRATSDPFATGQVLYGLVYLGRDASDPAVRRACRYLLDAQGDDGVWKLAMKTISATKKDDTKQGDAVYTYWATGWAAVGLSATLP